MHRIMALYAAERMPEEIEEKAQERLRQIPLLVMASPNDPRVDFKIVKRNALGIIRENPNAQFIELPETPRIKRSFYGDYWPLENISRINVEIGKFVEQRRLALMPKQPKPYYQQRRSSG